MNIMKEMVFYMCMMQETFRVFFIQLSDGNSMKFYLVNNSLMEQFKRYAMNQT